MTEPDPRGDESSSPYFSASTLDDLMRLVLETLLARGDPIKPGKGGAIELVGVLLELTNPRARLSRTEMRNTLFSCLGELCWYLAGSNDLAFISYYIPAYKTYADDNMIFGGYGPRLIDWKNVNQLDNVITILKNRPDSRKAVIQLFDSTDIIEDHKDVPCTCTIQFLLRRETLHAVTNMRSNDAYIGMPHDIFTFTMLQEIVARSLGVEVGIYRHAVGSLHLYDLNSSDARSFLEEGWQSTEMPMPCMPLGDPWPAIRSLLGFEKILRAGKELNPADLEDLDPYWGDLGRLLQAFRYRKDRNVERITSIASKMSSPIYSWSIDKQLRRIPGK